MDASKLKEILEKHLKWIKGENGGERADLYRADLSRANLSWADLSWANLSGANLSWANLYRADLSGANLSWANLYRADLSGANLYRADLSWADLSWARSIENAKNLFYPICCPECGAFVAWKKARLRNGHECIVKLEISEDAKRCSASGRKCRCSKAAVLEVQDIDGKILDEPAISDHDEDFHYIPGSVVSVSDFDENRWNECSTGIHFYITREEAVRHAL